MAMKKGASVVIVYGDRILLRPNGKRFQLIGGKSHPKESLIATAVRETTEETGLRLESNRLEPIHKVSFYTKEGDKIEHSFFLYRLTEIETTNDFSQIHGARKPLWFPLWLIKGKMICWFGYSQAIYAAKKRLLRNLLPCIAN